MPGHPKRSRFRRSAVPRLAAKLGPWGARGEVDRQATTVALAAKQVLNTEKKSEDDGGSRRNRCCASRTSGHPYHHDAV